MHTLPLELMELIVAFAPAFSQRVFAHAQVLLVGAILAPGTRTVSAVLRVMGMSEERCFLRYHRVLSRAVWSGLAGSRILLGLLIQAFAARGPLVLALDDTIERRRGVKIRARGIYRDPVRASHGHFVKASGLRWLSLMLLTPIGWAQRTWALPFLTVLCPSARYYTGLGRAHRTLLQRAAAMLHLVRRWHPTRVLVVVADSSFAALEFLGAVRPHAWVITRLRLDAALYAPAPVRRPGQPGRPRRKGARLPTLQRLLADPQTAWQTATLAHWYGHGSRAVEFVSHTAVWYHAGQPVVPLRWVLVRDPRGQFRPQAFLCTHPAADPAQILQWFVLRWQTEVTFEEARAHLGVETQRQWSDKAIARTTPLLLGLYALVTLLADRLIGRRTLPVRAAAWYIKRQPTFSDALALVRRCCWAQVGFSLSACKPDTVKIPRLLLERLTDTLCYAA